MTPGECKRFLVAQMAQRGAVSSAGEWMHICDRQDGEAEVREYRHGRLGVFQVRCEGGRCDMLEGVDFAVAAEPGEIGHTEGVAGATAMLRRLRALLDARDAARMGEGEWDYDGPEPLDIIKQSSEYKAFGNYLPFISSFCFPNETYDNGEMTAASLDEPMDDTGFCLLFEDRGHILESIENGLGELLWPLLTPGLDMCDEAHFMAEATGGKTVRQMVAELTGMGFNHAREDCAAAALLAGPDMPGGRARRPR